MIFNLAPWAMYTACLALGWWGGAILRSSVGVGATVSVGLAGAALLWMAHAPAWRR